MGDEPQPKRFVVAYENMPANFPTHLHTDKFWEALGRTVATFGFLEEMLGKAIFAFTGMRKIPEEDHEAELEKWLPTLERALHDALGGLTDSYAKAVKDYGKPPINNFDELINKLREAAVIRNVLCHSSWGVPDDQARSRPLFVNRKLMVFDAVVDIAYLEQVREHVVELACTVINTVTAMGWQFPGSRSPGVPVSPRPAGEVTK